MKDNILKIISGVGVVAHQVTNNVLDTSKNLIVDKILHNDFVTREEFENLQTLLIKLQKDLNDLKKK